jgi:hypothetical protein
MASAPAIEETGAAEAVVTPGISSTDTAQPIVTAAEAAQLGPSVLHALSAVGTKILQAGTNLPAALSSLSPSSPDEPYYWEQRGDPHPPVAKLITHNLHWVAMRTWGTMEVVGEFFSEVLGLNNSRYQWAMDLQNREDAAAEEAEAERERQRRWAEIKALNEKAAASKAGGAAAPVAEASGNGSGSGSASASAAGPSSSSGEGGGDASAAGPGSGGEDGAAAAV